MTAREGAAMLRTFSGAYKGWVLFLIFLMMTDNYVDRTIMGVVSQPIKAELDISDTGLGLLGGTSFALLYMFMGIPLARLAERFSRVSIMSITLVIWSLMTMLCGAAQSFWQMFALRIAVGTGEAGATPTSLSLIGDYFSAERRTSAVSMWSFGIATGGLVGAVAGGFLTQHFGWRAAFAIVGAPGLLLALVIQATLIEPPRGYSDKTTPSGGTPTLLDVTKLLIVKPAFVHTMIGGSLVNFAVQGINLFLISYFVRRFDLKLAEASALVGIGGGIATAAGMAAGGSLSDWAARHDRRWYSWVPAIGLALGGPIYALGFLQATWLAAIAFIAPVGIAIYIFHAPCIGLTLNLSPPKARATASALFSLCTSAIGLGLGPPCVGWLSDYFSQRAYRATPQGYSAACAHGVMAANAASPLKSVCLAASAQGLQIALVLASLVFIWAAVHFVLASRHVRRDLADALS